MLDRLSRYLPSWQDWLGILLGAAGLGGLYALSRHYFLLFHCLTEAFSIVIAIAVFAIFWNTRHFLDNGFYLVIGFGCLFAGILDVDYIFAYPGMSLDPGFDGNVALQAKTVAQWFVSFSCVAALPFLRRGINQKRVLALYSAILALAIGCIFYWHVFPDCLRKDGSITPFERIGLVISGSAYLVAFILLFLDRREFDSYVFRLLAATLIAFFVEDLACAVATDLNGPARTVAHLCQVIALFFVYKAFVEVGLRQPYDLLFRRQQQSAKALAVAASEWSVTFDAMADGVSVHDPDYTISNVNDSLCRMLGRSKEELIGRKCYQVFHGTTAPIAVCPIEKSMQSCCKEEAEFFEPTLNRWLATSASPVLDSSGRLMRLVHTVRDVTHRKRSEEALEQKVQQRTVELSETVEELHRQIADRKQAEATLREAERQAQGHQAELARMARVSMMGEMAASLAHELNQPLHAVKNYASGCIRRLSKTPGPDAQLVLALEQIGEEARRAAEIIRRVKGLVQKREPQVTDVQLNGLVAEVVLLSQEEIESRHARVVLELSDNLPAVLGDPILIEQVLMNLVRNGLEAMDETPAADRLLLVRSSSNSDEAVHVEVCDSGKGISPDDRQRVFEPFFSTKPEGMGMGLAISRSIIQSHGGRLWASPGEVRGCTFHFTLPAGGKGS